MLKTVVLLHIFKTAFKIEIFDNIINVFTVSFSQFKVS